jgi:uncharacterized membrane protein YphA (DoxX/SURF4 family)
MADAKISALPQDTLPTLADELAVNQAGTSKKVTIGSLGAVIGHVSGRATLASTARMVLEATMRWIISDSEIGGPLTLGEPRTIGVPAVIPDGYDYDAQNRSIIAGAGRLAIRGQGRLSIDQIDFRRSRLTLTGVG